MTGAGPKRSERSGELVEGGPRVVAIGGGHGLSRTLAALRHFAGAVTAVVSVADDGGSSGRLRQSFGIPAPGDVRRCITALLPRHSPLGAALEHRFSSGELGGHAFGNLVLAAMASSTGDFVAAVAECCRLLETVGEVIPATSWPVALTATVDGGELRGQARIKQTGGVRQLALDPPSPPVPDSALAAIAVADEIVIGPGSLYTSVLAALVAPQMSAALRSTKARRVYLCNLREQLPETAGYDVAAHVTALVTHGVEPDVVLCDSRSLPLGAVPAKVRVVDVPLAVEGSSGHDERLLSEALEKL